MANSQTTDKAARLVEDGHVKEDIARVFGVEGDHATYTVVVWSRESGSGVLCTCPHGMSKERHGLCSHALAAQHMAAKTLDPTFLFSTIAADGQLGKALSHPLRIRILTILVTRTASPHEIADELEAPLSNTSYHVRQLAELGLIELVETVPRRGAIEHRYRAKTNGSS